MPSHKLHWIGTGNAFNFDRGNTSFTVSGDGKRVLLVDCGGTVPLRLLQLDKLAPVTDVLITHLHADHVGGLESLIFFNFYALGRQFENKLRIHVATEAFAHRLWEHTLKGGMQANVDNKQNPITCTLDYYCEVHVHSEFQVDGLPKVRFFPTEHVANLENYGVLVGDSVRYSGDTIEPPTNLSSVAVHFQETEVRHPRVPGIHLTYEALCGAISDPAERAKIFLVHTGGNAEADIVEKDGFAGIVEPGQEFDI